MTPLSLNFPVRIWSVAAESTLDADAGQLPRQIIIGFRGEDGVVRKVRVTCARYMSEVTFEANCRKLRLLLGETILSAEIRNEDTIHMIYADKPENRVGNIVDIRDVAYIF